MLKTIKWADKEVPVPVPLADLESALRWVQKTLVNKDKTLTRFILDGEDVLTDSLGLTKNANLSDSSSLEAVIESPTDLSIEVLEGVRDMAEAIGRRVNKVAIDVWSNRDRDLLYIVEDLGLIEEMIHHANGIVDYGQELMAAINGIHALLIRSAKRLGQRIDAKDWKGVSVVLVNQIGPLLHAMVRECDNLQLEIYSSGKGKDSKLKLDIQVSNSGV